MIKPIVVGSTVRPLTGPHAGVDHKVIYVHETGGFNIQPMLPACRIKYRLGATYVRPDELEKPTMAERLQAIIRHLERCAKQNEAVAGEQRRMIKILKELIA